MSTKTNYCSSVPSEYFLSASNQITGESEGIHRKQRLNHASHYKRALIERIRKTFTIKEKKLMEGFFSIYIYTTLECYYSDWLMRFITQKTALLLSSLGESGSEMLHFYCQVSRQRHIKIWPLMGLDSCRCFTVLFLPPDNEEFHDF